MSPSPSSLLTSERRVFVTVFSIIIILIALVVVLPCFKLGSGVSAASPGAAAAHSRRLPHVAGATARLETAGGGTGGDGSGIAGGADVILIPEIKYSIDGIIKKLNTMKKYDIQHSLIVVAEAVKKEDGKKATVKFVDGEVRLGGIGAYLGDEIYKLTDAESRVTVLGHVQRGAQPTHRDRLIASAFGVKAVDLIADGKFNRVVVWQDRSVKDVSLDDIAGKSQTLSKKDPLIEVARGLGIYIGELS